MKTTYQELSENRWRKRVIDGEFTIGGADPALTNEPIIVEKTVVNLASGCRTELFALASSEPTPLSTSWSLTFEAYLSDWTPFRAALEGSL